MLPRKRGAHEIESEDVAESKLEDSDEALTKNIDIMLVGYCGIIQTFFGTDSNIEGIKPKHWRVSSTSIVYFRKFYSACSILDHDPRFIMSACLFLAGKVEDCFVSANELAVMNKMMKTNFSQEVLLATELILAEGLRFQLKVFHPRNIVSVVLSDMEKQLMELNPSLENKLKSEDFITYKRAWESAAQRYLSNLETSSIIVTFSPTEIAVFTLFSTESVPLCRPVLDAEEINFNRYLNIRFNNIERDALISKFVDMERLVQFAIDAKANQAQYKKSCKLIKDLSNWGKK